MIRTPAYWFSRLNLNRDRISQKIGLVFKRVFDVVFCTLGLIVLSPFFLIIAALIKIGSPGPVFYLGRRMGKDNVPFNIIKFRTMYETPASYMGPKVTCSDDPRVTRVGRWLRDTKINELPQLWNVIRGDMSLVGPRPEDPEIVAGWSEEERREILSVRPGITSPASVIYHDEEKLIDLRNVMGIYLDEILPKKLRLDVLYSRHRSFFADLDILFLTALIVFPRLLKRTMPDTAFFSGWIHRLANRFISWLVVDTLTAFVAISVIGVFYRNQAPLNWGFTPLLIFTILFSFLFGIANASWRLDRVMWSRATLPDAMKLVITGGVMTVTVMVLNHSQGIYYWLPYPALPQSMLFTIGLLTTIGFLFTRFRVRFFDALTGGWAILNNPSVAFGERVIIVGCGEESKLALWLLHRSYFRYAFKIVGMVDENPCLKGMKIEGCTVLGNLKDLPELIKKHHVGLLISTVHVSKLEQVKKMNHSFLRVVALDEILGALYHVLLQPVTTLEYSQWTSSLIGRRIRNG